jgi:thioredoxin-related protein
MKKKETGENPRKNKGEIMRIQINAASIAVMVDVGEKATKPLNRDLVDLYRVKGFGYPSLVVLDQKGRLICSQSTGVLEKGKAHDPERVLAFLKAQTPDKIVKKG